MNNQNYTDEELEEELERAFKASEKKPNIFKIIRNEKNALDKKEKRLKVKIKPKKKLDE